MNENRRKALTKIQDDIEAISFRLVQLQDSEQEAYDAMPSSLQCSDKGKKAQAAIGAIENALDNIEDTIIYIEEAKE